jgi:hypothetical protein
MLTVKIQEMSARLPPSRERSPGCARLGRYLDAEPELKQFSFLKKLGSSTAIFKFLPLIPDLVALYDWIYDEFSGKLSRDEANHCSMSHLFSKSPAYSRMDARYAEICERWNKMHTELRGIVEVGGCENRQQFIRIDRNTSLLAFVTVEDAEENNFLIRVRCAGLNIVVLTLKCKVSLVL